MSVENTLLRTLREQMRCKLPGGIYHYTQVTMAYNSNHIEGSRLSAEQTRFLYDTHTVVSEHEAVKTDDIIETLNHFLCLDSVLVHAGESLTEAYIKSLHGLLKRGTTDSELDWFAVGEYKRLPNEVGTLHTCPPEEVPEQMALLLRSPQETLEDLLHFHVQFERIHPFQDGNGRVGRLLLFQQCLSRNLVPFIITDEMKFYYYRGLQEWDNVPGYLRDTCLTAIDEYVKQMAYFQV